MKDSVLKTTKYFFVSAGIVAFSQTAVAQEVGDLGKNVKLSQVQLDDSIKKHNILDVSVPSQYTILMFCHTECPSCLKTLKYFHDLTQDVERQATTRMVMMDWYISTVRKYVQTHRDEVNFEVAADVDYEATDKYDIEATPTTFVLDPRKKILYRKVGALHDDDVMEISKLVGAMQP